MANVLTLASSDADFADCGVDRSLLANAHAAAQAWVQSGETTGLIVAAARRGLIVLHDAFGVLRPDSNEPIPLDAVVPIASITKPIVATALMCLVEDGLVGLNRPVHEYIPEFAGDGREDVAVWHLVTHTAGFGTLEAGEVDESLSSEDAIAAYVELGCRMALSSPPGSTFSYSDVGFELAAEIVRRMSGESLEGFVQRRIFDPLGMRDTFLVVPEAARKRLALRYSEHESSVDDRYMGRLEGLNRQRTPWGGSGAYSTAGDLLIFGQTFLQHGAYGDARIMSPAGVRLMTTPQTGDIPMQFVNERWPLASWGLGWHIHGSAKGRRGPSLYSPSTFEHVGAGGSLLWVDPENEVVGVCLSLLRQGSPWLYPAWQGDLVINAIMAALDA